MRPDGAAHPAEALAALAAARQDFTALTEADFQAAALLLARKLLTAPRQNRATIARLREVLGADLFNAALGALTPKQAVSLARRISRGRDKPELETHDQASAFIAGQLGFTPPPPQAPAPPKAVKAEPEPLLADAPSAEPQPEPETGPQTEPQIEPEPEPATSGNAGAYFGRKAFRTS